MNFHGEKRSNDTHESTTDPDARLARKSAGHESKLAYCGNVLIENRNGLVVDTELVHCNGTAERDAAMKMAERIEGNEAGDGGRRQGIRHAGLGARDARLNVTPHVSQNTSDRAAAPSTGARHGMPDTGEPAETETDRRSIRMVKDGGHAAQDPASRHLQSGMGIHLRGGGLQPRAHAESAVTGGSVRISPGRSVSGMLKNRAFRLAYPPRK